MYLGKRISKVMYFSVIKLFTHYCHTYWFIFLCLSIWTVHCWGLGLNRVSVPVPGTARAGREGVTLRGAGDLEGSWGLTLAMRWTPSRSSHLARGVKRWPSIIVQPGAGGQRSRGPGRPPGWGSEYIFQPYGTGAEKMLGKNSAIN